MDTAAPISDILPLDWAARRYGQSPGATPDVRIITPSEFQPSLHRAESSPAMTTEVVEISNQDTVGYPGDWYQRPDGSSFGSRTSVASGPTIDVDGPALLRGFKVHQR